MYIYMYSNIKQLYINMYICLPTYLFLYSSLLLTVNIAFNCTYCTYNIYFALAALCTNAKLISFSLYLYMCNGNKVKSNQIYMQIIPCLWYIIRKCSLIKWKFTLNGFTDINKLLLLSVMVSDAFNHNTMMRFCICNETQRCISN